MIRFSSRKKADRGGVLVITALLLPLMIALLGLAVDLGVGFIAKTEAETAAAMGAESGSVRIADPARAQDLARAVALEQMRGHERFSRNLAVETEVVGGEVRVDVSLEVFNYFAAMFRGEPLVVRATAQR